MPLYEEIEKKFPRVAQFFSEEELSEFINMQDEDLENYNIGTGTMIRLKLLNPRSVLYREFIRNGVTDKDEMTMEILRAFHEYISDEL